jgi:radical SAM superfamily enzyme YgiQ (UPF0313 family)
MKIIFIFNGSEHIGIEYLSSFIKSNGHTTSLLFDPAIFTGQSFLHLPLLGKCKNIDRRIVDKVITQKPDLICFSCFTGNYAWCIQLANKIRNCLETPIVFGGVHPTAVPKSVLKNSCVDYVIVGEGEHALLELLDNIKTGKESLHAINNLGYKANNEIFINPLRPYIKALDSLPLPDKDMFYDKVPMLAEMYAIITSRGCPFSCTYCSNNMTHRLYCEEKNHVRRRSANNVIEELRIAKSKYKIKSVMFLDDVFTVSYKWLQEFIPLYIRDIGIPFSCTTHPNFVKSNIIELLKQGGCWSIQLGIQSGSARIRNDIFGRSETNAKILESCQVIKEAKIKLFTDIIMGAPTETVSDMNDSLDLLSAIKPDRLVTFFLTYYPGTEIVNIAQQNKTITSYQCNEIEQGIIGYTHSSGSIAKDNIDMYRTFDLKAHLRVLLSTDKVYNVLSHIASYLPCKGLLTSIVKLLVSLKIGNVRYSYYIRYILAKKSVP